MSRADPKARQWGRSQISFQEPVRAKFNLSRSKGDFTTALDCVLSTAALLLQQLTRVAPPVISFIALNQDVHYFASAGQICAHVVSLHLKSMLHFFFLVI